MLPSYLLSIETPTPLVLGVGVMFAPVTGFVTFVRFGRRLSGNFCVEEYLHCVSRLLAFRLCSFCAAYLPSWKLLREFRFLGLLLLPSP